MHIMLALDDSRYAEAIIQWMKRFPHPVGARLTLLHVVEPLDVPEEFAAKPAVRSKQRMLAEEVMSRASRELQKEYADIKVNIVEGFPIYEILRAVREKSPDLIVSGTRGLRGAKGLALGSVSQRLLSYAPCSVMLVPAKPRAARRLKVTVATDGSRGGQEAVRFITLLPEVKEVTVLTTVRPVDARELEMSAAFERKGGAQARSQLREARESTATRVLEKTADVLRRSGVVVKTRKALGHPAEAIPKEAKRLGTDLLVIGSRGMTGKMALTLGSVSLAVAQSAPCAVVVVRRWR